MKNIKHAIAELTRIQATLSMLLDSAFSGPQDTMLVQALNVLLLGKANTELEVKLLAWINQGPFLYRKVTNSAHEILKATHIEIAIAQDFFKAVVHKTNVALLILQDMEQDIANNAIEGNLQSFTVILNKILYDIDRLKWCFAYSEQIWYGFCVENNIGDPYLLKKWHNGPIFPLLGCLQELAQTVEAVKYMLNERQIIAKFLKDFKNTDAADVFICSIGCGGVVHQQVYPWVYDFAQMFPQVKIRIDLFDRFSSESAIADGLPSREQRHPQYRSLPDCVLVEPHMWLQMHANHFQHKQLPNINVHAHDAYFPTLQKLKFAGDKLYAPLESAIEQHLAHGKLVYLSQHVGGDYIFPEIIIMYNKLNICKVKNHKNLILMGCSGETFDPVASELKQQPQSLIMNMLQNNAIQIPVDNSVLADYISKNTRYFVPQVERIDFAFAKWKKSGNDTNAFPLTKYLAAIPETQPQTWQDILYNKHIAVPSQVTAAMHRRVMDSV